VKRLGAALLVAVAVVPTVTVIAVLHKNTRQQERASALATRACLRSTDAARRQYLQVHASAAHLSYIEALTDMYARCPGRTPKPARSAFHPAGSIARTSAPHRHHPSRNKRGASEEKDDGGD
jgi:hypothetical protein